MPEPYTFEGEIYRPFVAKIEETKIGIEDRGLTALVTCKLEDGWTQAFFANDLHDSKVAGRFIESTLWAAEAPSWEKLVGKTLVVYKKDRHAYIAGIFKLFPLYTEEPYMFVNLYKD